MKAFTFVRPTTVAEAVQAAAEKGAVIKAGGIDLLDRMKERIEDADRVVWLGDVKELGISGALLGPEKDRVVLGATTTLAQIAASDEVRKYVPALAEAAGLAASPQIRARATIAGNLAQHTRCGYYRHASFPCWKRGDDACPVLADGAVQETAAILANRPCASAHPSSLAPVLAACSAEVGWFHPAVMANGRDTLVPGHGPITDLYDRSPQRGKPSDLAIDRGSMRGVIRTIEIPCPAGRRSAYEEVRQKAAFDWALVSCCVRVDMSGDKVSDAAVWLGSVAPTPWHAEAADKALVGKTLTDETIRAAADAAVVGATPLPGNAYKVDLVKVVVRRALERLRAMK